MLRPATSSSSLPQQRPRACGGRTAARLAPFRHHAAGSSAARPFSTPLPSIKAAPRPRIAVIPGGGPDSGRALGHSPFGPAQASFPSPAPAKNYLNQELTSNGPPGVSAASLPPRSSAGEQLSPHSFPRGTPQQIAEEVEAVRKLYPGGFSGLVNLPKFPGNLSEITRSRPKFNTAGRSATALAVGEDVLTESSGSGSGGAAGQRPASPDTSAPDASAVAAARLLRGALEAALLPRLEALEGRIVEAVEGRVVQRMMDMEQQREEVVGARERQLTAALEAMAAVMREQGKGKGEKGEGQELEQGKGQQVLGQGKEQWEQGQQAEGQGEEKGEEQGQRNEGHGQDQQGQEQEQQGEGQGQGQADHEQPLVDALAAQEQRIREELKAEVAALRSELQAAVAQMQQEREGQVAAPAPAAQEQRTREELKAQVMTAMRSELQAAVAKMRREREGQVAATAAAVKAQSSDVQPAGAQQPAKRKPPAWKGWLRRLLTGVVNVIWAAVYLTIFAGSILTFIHVCGNTDMAFVKRCGGAVASGAVVFLMGRGIISFCDYCL